MEINHIDQEICGRFHQHFAFMHTDPKSTKNPAFGTYARKSCTKNVDEIDTLGVEYAGNILVKNIIRGPLKEKFLRGPQ